MLVPFLFSSSRELINFLRGTFVASGNAGTNSGGSPNFQDLTTGAFADVEVGHRIYISGESASTVFTVITKTDANNIVLDNNIVAAHSTNGIWRAYTGNGIALADIAVGPFVDGEGKGYLIYEVETFAN